MSLFQTAVLLFLGVIVFLLASISIWLGVLIDKVSVLIKKRGG